MLKKRMAITILKKLEFRGNKAAKKSSGKDIFFSHNPNPMWIYNPENLKILEVNEAATELYGYTEDEMTSITIKNLRDKSEIPRMQHAVHNAKQSFTDSGIWKHQKKNKETLYVHILSYPIEWEGVMCRLVVAQDVSDKYWVDRKLKQSRAQLQKIMDQSPAVICTIDEYGKFVQVSAAAQHIWGYHPESLINEKYIDFVHPDDVASTNRTTDEILKGKEVTNFENRYIRIDGKSVPMEWSARWDSEDEVMYYVGRDATDVKEAEKEIDRERKMLRAIINNIPDYVYVKDRHRRFMLSNKALSKEVLGPNSAKEVLGKTVHEIYPPEIAKPIDDDDRRVIETGEPIVDRLETIHNYQREKLWLLTTKVPLRNQNNEIYGLVGITRNITDRKKIQDEIKFAKERYEMVIKATKDTVFDWDLVTNTMNWGSNFMSASSLDPDMAKYTAEYWIENIHPDDRPYVQKSLRQVLETPSELSWEVEYRYLKAEGTYASILENAFIIRDEYGTAIRMIGALQDVTKLKLKEQELSESVKEKEILLTEIHHRVKNNLAIISGMLQLQALEEEEKVRDKLMNGVRRIKSIALIHEQLYRSESFSSLNFSVNLKELAYRIVDTFKSAKEIQLSCKLDPVQLNINQAIPASLIANEVLTNILKHAFKNAEKGKITLRLRQIYETISLEIKDNGTGLSDGCKEKGETLGRIIIDELAKQLDALYEYKSQEEGTVFTLRFNKVDLKGIGNHLL